jgi:dolichyl-phosphate-mannose--protein O-mannosyl transferase
LLLAAAFHHNYRRDDRWIPAAFLVLSFGLFVYFYPILSAAPLPDDRAFEHWMWLSTWP